MEPSDRGSLPGEVREAVLEANIGCCTYCSWGVAEAVDHVVPLDEGGRDDITNLVPVCKSCNSSKRNRTVGIWRRDVRSRTSRWNGDSLYHEPDRLIDWTSQMLALHIRQGQAEVVEGFRPYELKLATQLISDANRLIGRLGNLSPECGALLTGEFQARLAEQEGLLTAEPEARLRVLREANWRQYRLKRRLRDFTQEREERTAQR
ncbi:HNH endonuclease [Streptomyces sp. NPDC006704]|uniref:HNH endonuclease n=1 Tax=Streptomyces sp. NPDC006704 TaxID=3364760 RepID=UPI00367EF7CE